MFIVFMPVPPPKFILVRKPIRKRGNYIKIIRIIIFILKG